MRLGSLLLHYAISVLCCSPSVLTQHTDKRWVSVVQLAQDKPHSRIQARMAIVANARPIGPKTPKKGFKSNCTGLFSDRGSHCRSNGFLQREAYKEREKNYPIRRDDGSRERAKAAHKVCRNTAHEGLWKEGILPKTSIAKTEKANIIPKCDIC